MKKILLALISIVVFLSCTRGDDNTSEVNIRVANVSPYDFQNVVIHSSSSNSNFENINTQATTTYKVFETAYRYAFVELEIDGETYTMQPTDYVGETPLKNGFYTYIINANDSQDQYGRLSLILRED